MAKKNKIAASRGSVNNIILNSLVNGDKYGYEIIKEVEQQTNGKVKLKQPSLYSSLKRFEQKGYITSYWGDSDIGGRRHYYSITPTGKAYALNPKQKIQNEKILDDKIEDVVDIAEDDNLIQPYEFEIDETEDNDVYLQNKYSTFNVDEKMNELLFDDNQTNNALTEEEQEYLQEIDNAIVDSKLDDIDYEEESEPEDTEEEIDNDLIYDHHFYKSTPLTELELEKRQESYNKLFAPIEQPDQNDSAEELQDITTEDNLEETKEEVIENKKPRIITDEFGITKLEYEDQQKQTEKKVFDNVVVRATPPKNIFDNDKIKSHKVLYQELSDEQRELKNQKFMQKFDTITQEKSSGVPNTDYKNKLNNLFVSETEDIYISSREPVTEDINQYDYNDEENLPTTKPDVSIKDISDALEKDGVNIKVYKKQESEIFQSNYLLVNKAKFIFGITMLIVMLLQITACLIVLKNKGLLYENHFWIYHVSYVLMALVALYYCLPVFITPNKQSTTPFKLRYAIMFGTLAFFILALIIYSINTFMGLDFNNIKFFLSTLVVPTVLSSNFIFGPIIFKIISLNKKLY